MRKSILLGAVAISAAVASTGCRVENVVQLAPSPTADSVAFVVRGIVSPTAPSTLAYGLSVIRCLDQQSMWTISADGTRGMPDTVRYGAIIPGFHTLAGPLPLTVGCYQVVVSRAAPVTFDVSSTGRLTVRTPR